jgi:hypothetical protein
MRRSPSRNDWRSHGDRVPGIGSLVCIHRDPSGAFSWIGIVTQLMHDEDGYTKYCVRPWRLPQSDSRYFYWGNLETVVTTFEGPRCLRCGKGDIR